MTDSQFSSSRLLHTSVACSCLRSLTSSSPGLVLTAAEATRLEHTVAGRLHIHFLTAVKKLTRDLGRAHASRGYRGIRDRDGACAAEFLWSRASDIMPRYASGAVQPAIRPFTAVQQLFDRRRMISALPLRSTVLRSTYRQLPPCSPVVCRLSLEILAVTNYVGASERWPVLSMVLRCDDTSDRNGRQFGCKIEIGYCRPWRPSCLLSNSLWIRVHIQTSLFFYLTATGVIYSCRRSGLDIVTYFWLRGWCASN